MILYYFALGIFVRFGQSLQFLWLRAAGLCPAKFVLAVGYGVGKCPGGLCGSPILLALGLPLLCGEVIILRAGCIEAPAGLDHRGAGGQGKRAGPSYAPGATASKRLIISGKPGPSRCFRGHEEISGPVHVRAPDREGISPIG